MHACFCFSLRGRAPLLSRAATPLIASLFALLFPAALVAQPPADTVAALRAELDQMRRQYEDRLAELDRRLTEIETENESLREIAAATEPEAPPPPAVAPVPAPPVTGGGDAAMTSNYWNPAMAVIGNFLGVAGNAGGGDEAPSAELRESEIGLQAVVDPYARADVFLAFGEEGVEVEEGYVTLTALPANLLAKVGRMRAGFGKVNTLHLHSLPWPDQPLPVVNLLGGDEGWIGTGVSIASLLPLPADTFSEATLQVFGGSSELFPATERSDLAYNLHYRVFRDLTDSTNLDLGLSYAQGPNGVPDSSDTRLAGLDLTYRWKPLERGSYRGAIFRGEVYRSRRDEIESLQHALGWFASADYQLARRWWAGARYEWSERADDESLRDTGEALTLSFSPSEFMKLRGEVRRRDFADSDTATELLLQLQFAAGAHGAHPF
jgi:hypothetical protein